MNLRVVREHRRLDAEATSIAEAASIGEAVLGEFFGGLGIVEIS